MIAATIPPTTSLVTMILSTTVIHPLSLTRCYPFPLRHHHHVTTYLPHDPFRFEPWQPEHHCKKQGRPALAALAVVV